jgi:DNA-binding NarL/FixJ family response regulator
MTTKIIVVDDHHLFRAGVVEMLTTVPDFEVVAEGGSGVEAITLAHERQPDVAVLDLEMPGPGVKVMVRRVLDASPGTRIVILTMHDDPNVVRDLLDAGASGYLLKTAGRSELIAAIKSASGTEESVLLAVSRRTALSLTRPESVESELLTRRELEVVSLLTKGRSNREIAAALFISGGTVKRHLTNIYAKLGVRSRLEAAEKVRELGIVHRAAVVESGSAVLS